MANLSIGVVGAGVVGLTTALELQREFRHARVEILADKFGDDTTSFVAAGFFRPGTSFSGPDETTTWKWIADSYRYWDDILRTSEAPRAGIMQLSGYMLSNENPGIVRNHLIEKIVPVYRAATEDELVHCPGNWKYGSFFTTIVTECGLYMPWVSGKFIENGGRIINRRIGAFNELAGKYDIVVNCTGLGSKYLCSDYKLVPLRGQVIKVEAKWLDKFYYGDYDTYIIPGFEGVTLGGTRQYDSYDLRPNKYDAASIRERCESMVPSLKQAKVIAHRVGLRPHRDPVRVETETLNCNENKMKIVHNYGHGGYGVTTAPGTSLHAVRLVRESLLGNSKL